MLVLGKGSNLLVGDKGVDAVVVTLGGELAQMRLEKDGKMWAGAGAMMDKVARMTVEEGFAGLEWATGLPGTVGGAVVGNAGAWGGCVGDALAAVEVMERSGEVKEIPAAEAGLVYRGSRLRESGWIVAGARFQLRTGNREELLRIVKENGEKRRLGQPGGATAGSVFRNPEGDSAGRLLDQAGCKGLRRGGAVVSTKHANFIINEGGATAADVMGLIEEMKERVCKQFGVELREEVALWGTR